MTLELFRVTLEYSTPTDKADWEKRLSEHVRRSPSVPFSEPMPPPHCVDRYVAVYPEFGAVALISAGTLALTTTVGPQEEWERFQAVVLKVERVDSVAIQPCTQQTKVCEP